MDLSYGSEYDTFREEVRAFLAEAWPPERRGQERDRVAQRAFLEAAVSRGYLYRSIPKKYGGSEQPFDTLKGSIIYEEFDASGAPWHLGPQNVGMLVPTLLGAGSEWQREHFIPPTLLGDFTWCQGYSEPGAGSDLASLRSTAELDGDEWVINGHKVWTSDAETANYMFGMFRTEPDAPKHGGISYLLLEMKQPGIEVRPLRQITGATHFYEVFFTDVRTPAGFLVGERGEGWSVSRLNLKHERSLGGGARQRQRLRGLLDLARRTQLDGRPAIEHEAVRHRFAELEGYVRCGETMTLRQLSASARDEDAEVATSYLVNKLFGSLVGEKMAQLGYDLIGADGLRAPTDSSWGSIAGAGAAAVKPNTDFIDQYLFELGGHIAAGSSNIQRNVIGERALGLPRDLRRPR